MVNNIWAALGHSRTSAGEGSSRKALLIEESRCRFSLFLVYKVVTDLLGLGKTPAEELAWHYSDVSSDFRAFRLCTNAHSHRRHATSRLPPIWLVGNHLPHFTNLFDPPPKVF